jgi:PKD repeat protein
MKRMTRMFLSIVLLAGLLWPCTTVYKNPTAVIDVNKTEVTPGTRLYFDGSNSHDNDENGNSIAYYEWYIDDSDTPESEGSRREEFDYRFNTIRDYTVKLTVRDDEGKSASQTITITVKAAKQRYYHLADHLGNVRATACPG